MYIKYEYIYMLMNVYYKTLILSLKLYFLNLEY
jgi:hypothetical protein